MITASFDTRKFNKMARDLARLSGKSVAHVIRHEGARVIEKAVKLTPAVKTPNRKAFINQIERTHSGIEDSDGRQIYRSDNGMVWLGERVGDNRNVYPFRPRVSAGKNGRVFYRMNDPQRRWNPHRWAAFLELEGKRLVKLAAAKRDAEKMHRAIREARGLSKRSWWEAGRALGLPMRAVPKYVQNARPSNGKSYVNGKGREFTSGDAFVLELENSYPALVKDRVRRKGKTISGRQILQRAINSRVAAFRHSIRKGVFDNILLRASRHPGIFVK